MTDETTARDRGTYGDGTPSYPGDPGREHECPTPIHHPLTDCQTCHPTTARDRATEDIASTLEQLAEPTVKHGKWILGQLARQVRALAGAPTADVADFLRWLVAMDESSGAIAREARRTVTLTQIIDRARALLAAAPEGVDAADELRIAREQYASTRGELERVHDSREQVYRERDEACTQRTAAQGELHRRNVEAKSATIRAAGLADDLAAAQAAIQRVEALPEKWETEQAAYPGTEQGLAAAAAVRLCAREVRGALDGDTTEEEA